MKNALRLSLLAMVSASLFACGSGAKLGGGKEGAASALFAATGQTKASGSVLSLAGQGVDLHGDVTASCPLAGKVTLKGFALSTNLTGSSTSVKTTYSAVYEGCAISTFDNPNTPAIETDKVEISGTMTVTQDIGVTGTSGSVAQTLKGKLTFAGAFDDFIDADITQSVEWAKLGSTGGSVTVNLNGSLKTSSESYTYTNESVTITAGQLIAAADK